LSGLDVTDNSKTGLYICGPRVGIGSVGPSPKGGGAEPARPPLNPLLGLYPHFSHNSTTDCQISAKFCVMTHNPSLISH